MNKEEVLQKAKNSTDERERQISVKSSSIAGIVVTIVLGILLPLHSMKHQPVSDLFTVLLAYWSVQYFYLFNQLKKRRFLFLGVLTTVGFVVAAVSYIIWG